MLGNSGLPERVKEYTTILNQLPKVAAMLRDESQRLLDNAKELLDQLKETQ